MVCDERTGMRRWPDLRPAAIARLAGAAPASDERAMLGFLEEAEAAGFSPRVDRWSAFEATARNRGAFNVRRMRELTPEGRRQRWEVVLDDFRMSGFVLGFESAARLAMRWLMGENEETVWAALRPIAHHRCRNGRWIDQEGEPE
jgi:hypothetical protein